MIHPDIRRYQPVDGMDRPTMSWGSLVRGIVVTVLCLVMLFGMLVIA